MAPRCPRSVPDFGVFQVPPRCHVDRKSRVCRRLRRCAAPITQLDAPYSGHRISATNRPQSRTAGGTAPGTPVRRRGTGLAPLWPDLAPRCPQPVPAGPDSVTAGGSDGPVRGPEPREAGRRRNVIATPALAASRAPGTEGPPATATHRSEPGTVWPRRTAAPSSGRVAGNSPVARHPAARRAEPLPQVRAHRDRLRAPLARATLVEALRDHGGGVAIAVVPAQVGAVHRVRVCRLPLPTPCTLRRRLDPALALERGADCPHLRVLDRPCAPRPRPRTT